ncbi:SEL1-like repeat protein [Sphingosinicella sp.]|uniref:SEL1-like repeat protein n=1 Tax=Sphingosinicella sp. TaxID=1917971 RepID=UPI002615BBE7|nr:SEL1-like repeat protein [Sphingosinicella sp.]
MARIEPGGAAVLNRRTVLQRHHLSIAVAALLVGCAVDPYADIALQPGAASTLVQEEARRAMAGDKYAQLALGKRFEAGIGVPQSYRKAKRLYEQAASDSGGIVWVYSPPVGKEKTGRTVPINTGPKVAGLPEAKAWLAGMRTRIIAREDYR